MAPLAHRINRSRRIDDSVHPLLRKARPPDQLLIDELERGPGRGHYGPVQVMELDANAALTDFTMGGNVTGVAWSINPYAGCAHGCAYCYVPDTMHAERARWGRYVVVKRNLPALLSRELRTRPMLSVYASTATDAYQPAEQEHRITRRCLELLAKADWPLEVLTRSPLVLRDVDLLSRFSEVRVGLSVPTLDDRLRAVVEPSAPPIPARFAALERLAAEGIPTFANYTPAYPLSDDLTPTDLARSFKEAGVLWVNTSPWRRLRTIMPAVRARLAGTEYEGLAAMIDDERRQRRLQRALRVAFDREGLPMHTGFFNPPFAERRTGQRPHTPFDGEYRQPLEGEYRHELHGEDRQTREPAVGAEATQDRDDAVVPGGNARQHRLGAGGPPTAAMHSLPVLRDPMPACARVG